MSSNGVMIAELVVNSARHLSLNIQDHRELLVKVVLLSLKYIDRKRVFEEIFPGHFVDWGMLRPDTNLLGGIQVWLPLLDLFTWPDFFPPERDCRILHNMSKLLTESKLDTSDRTLACKLLITHLLNNIPSLHAFEVVTCTCFKRDTHNSCAILLSKLSDTPYTPHEYEQLFVLILGPSLKVDLERISIQLRNTVLNKDSHSEALKIRDMMLNRQNGRPRLRDKLKITSKKQLCLDTALGTTESYVAWCQVLQFPNILSETVKTRLYFMAAQTSWRWREHLQDVLKQNSEDICSKIEKYPVSQPDLNVISNVIGNMCMDGTAPFPEMIEFKNKCFKNFPVSHVQKMNLSQVYVYDKVVL